VARVSADKVAADIADLFAAAVKLHQAGRLDEAEARYRRVLQAEPDHADALNLLGVLCNRMERHDSAVALIRRAIALNGQNPGYFSNLGNALQKQNKLDAAVAAYGEAIGLKPDFAEAHHNLGAALEKQGKLDAALAAHQQALALKPDFAAAHSSLGTLLKTLGQLPEARAALEQAVRLEPRNAKFRLNHAAAVRFAAGDPHLAAHLAAMEQLIADGAALAADDRINLHFALAKAHEDAGRHADAFRQWRDGNALKRGRITYREDVTLQAFDRIRAVFTPALIRARHNAGQPSAAPVFILGMPRSGSTLIEQILASHPRVFGGGEMKHFDAAVQAIRIKSGGPAIFPELVSAMTDDDCRELSARYLGETERLAPPGMLITDKASVNFLLAGFIHLALPNARIIHSVRDPVDTCLSCFSILFEEGQHYTYDLSELGRYYRHYQDLMAHWHRVLPAGRILDVRYEDVVADLETEARRVVAHCGLDWDARCLAFHRTQRPILTASAAQVRQPIYNTAVGRWRVHEQFLGPLLAELAIAGGAKS
jgi:tetratricopeptide (TPR) repeat protein